MTELLDLTGAQAARAIADRELSASELFEAYRQRAAANDLNAFTWVADAGPEPNGAAGPLWDLAEDRDSIALIERLYAGRGELAIRKDSWHRVAER